ncbi:hypothetical protein FB451DRAFT_1374414 [Mycena latifolia]|nr:hypothetical protein FB451DRAFT_1374414 [Mycena latifolia]
MPRAPTIIDIHLDSIVACLNAVLPVVNELHDSFGTPFMQAISTTTLHLISAVQLMQNIHGILFAIVKLHMQSEPQGSLPPSTLDQIGKFTNTLHRIHTFIEGQQEKNRIKHFLRQSEMRMLLKDCRAGLQQALEVFKIETSILADVLEIQEKTEKLHEELLDLISNMTEGSSDRSSSIYHSATGSQNSSISFGLLPAKPKIFHGRESELHEILQNFCNKEAPRVAILGTGGIGKTSLAKAALHHPDISAKYETKLFVACDSATTSIEVAALVGSNIGLKPGRDLTKPVVQHFAQGPPSLLVLDNLETPWEKIESRGGVEEFLSLLTDVPHLALIITMRGAERPAKVRWTHPLLLPLRPLSNDAARKTFIDITDNDHDSHEITQLLEITDNLPLAVDLLAHLVEYEGGSNVLARWKTEKTYMLSEGHDKGSNLNSSIALSLSSPRMTSGAKGLLSLLSILPDGLSNSELIQSNLPIPDPLTCKAVLLQTSLAYSDNMWLKVLVPIREHVQQIHPPSPSLITGMVDQINSNLHNIHNILLSSLHPDNPELVENIHCILSFNSFQRLAGHDILIDQAVHHLANLNDASLASKFYDVAGGYYHDRRGDIAMSLQFFSTALTLAKNCANFQEQACILNSIALTKHAIGDYSGAQGHARDAQERSQICGNVYQEALALNHQALCCSYLGNNKAAIAFCQEARQLLQLCGKSEYAESRNIHASIAHRSSPTKDPWGYTLSLLNIANIDVVTGKPAAEVYVSLEKAKEILTAMCVPSGLGFCQVVLASLKLRERNIPEAKTLFQECLNCQWGKDADTVTYALERLANVSCWPSDEIKWSLTWAVVYLAYAKKLQRKVDLYKAFQFLGDGFMLQGDEDTAQSLFEVALEAFMEMDIHRSRAHCMLRLGDIAKQRGDLVKALRLWRDARPLFERSSQANEVAEIDTRLAAVDGNTLQNYEESLQFLRRLDAPTTLLATGIDQLNIEVGKDRGPTIEPIYTSL